MVLKSLLVVPLLATSLLVPARCEAEGVDANPYTGYFHADRVTLFAPSNEYHCVHGVVGWFNLDGYTFSIIDFECDNSIDAIRREDGLQLLVVPNRSNVSRLDFDPETDIDWESVIDDETTSPFVEQNSADWLKQHALRDLEAHGIIQQNIAVSHWSVEEWTADVTLATASSLEYADPQEHGLTYQWFTAPDERSDIECWSIRVRGDLTDVIRWLIENGVRETRTMYRLMDFTCTWVPQRNSVECRRGGVLIATIDLDG